LCDTSALTYKEGLHW